jgi:hypothetical protein
MLIAWFQRRFSTALLRQLASYRRHSSGASQPLERGDEGPRISAVPFDPFVGIVHLIIFKIAFVHSEDVTPNALL